MGSRSQLCKMQTQVLYLVVSVSLILGAEACRSSASPASETMSDINVLLGKTLDEASNILKNENIIYKDTRIARVRPTIIDGEHMIVTMDHREDRINVEVRDGKVVKILKSG